MKKVNKLLSVLLVAFGMIILNTNLVQAATTKKVVTNKKVYTVKKVNPVDVLSKKYIQILNNSYNKKAATIYLTPQGYSIKVSNSALNIALKKTSQGKNIDKLSLTRVYSRKTFKGYVIRVQYKKQQVSNNNSKNNTQQTNLKQNSTSYNVALNFFLDYKDKEEVNKLNYQIAKALFDGKNSVYIPSEFYAGDISKLGNAVKEVAIDRYSDFAYLRNISYTADSKGATLYFSYYINQDEIVKMNTGLYDVVKNVASKIQANINAAKTVEEKVKIIHDFIAYNFRYDVDFLKSNDMVQYSRDSHAYYALTNNKAICGGYASAFQRLTKYFGIESVIIKGYSDGGHAWNKIKIGDTWFHVDVTFDDPIVNGDPNKNMIRYDYFLKTDSEMAKTHSWN